MDSIVQGRGQTTAGLGATRAALSALFLLNGVGIASWAAHVPFIKQRFAFSDAILGLGLLLMALGSVVALLGGAPLVARLGSRSVIVVAALVFCAALPLLMLVPVAPLLFLLLPIFGASIGAMEVAINTEAVAVEGRFARPIMSSFHALFSVGGLLGAAVAALALARGVSPRAHMGGVALALVALVVIATPRLLAAAPAREARAASGPTLALPRGPLLALGVLAFFCLVAEGAMADWSAVYLRDRLGTDPAFAAAGYAAFSVAMAAGRFGGDWLRARTGAVLLVRSSAALAALGLGVSLLIARPLAALLGFACVGLGLANIVPILFTAAGRTAGVASESGIATVASCGYFGFLIGPPLIGFVAGATSLAWGLAIVALFIAIIALLAGRAGRAELRD
jgi:predicted MFS family arabinose efflux permease